MPENEMRSTDAFKTVRKNPRAESVKVCDEVSINFTCFLRRWKFSAIGENFKSENFVLSAELKG